MDETWEAFCELPGTQDAVLSGLLRGATNVIRRAEEEHDKRIDTILDKVSQLPRAHQIGDILRDVVAELKTAKQNGSGAAQVAPTLESATPKPVAGEFNVQCAHCGSWFMGATKYASLCGDCQLAGHRNVRTHDCRECQNAASI